MAGEEQGAQPPKNLDLLETPIEAVAAYWLALRTLLGSNRTMKPLEEEAAHTSDPFAKILLDLVCAEFGDAHFLRLAEARQELVLMDLRRRLDLMAMALGDMADKENPHRTLARMLALFPQPPADPARIIKYSQTLSHKAFDAAQGARLYGVSHRLSYDVLMGTLLFYVLMGRKSDRMAAQPYLPFVQSRYFSDGLALIIDGFDRPFLRGWLEMHRDTLLVGARRKTDLSREAALAIKNRASFEDVKRIAAVFI